MVKYPGTLYRSLKGKSKLQFRSRYDNRCFQVVSRQQPIRLLFITQAFVLENTQLKIWCVEIVDIKRGWSIQCNRICSDQIWQPHIHNASFGLSDVQSVCEDLTMSTALDVDVSILKKKRWSSGKEAVNAIKMYAFQHEVSHGAELRRNVPQTRV